MKIPLVFLGTSQAIPTADRNHTSILLSYKSENILVDCGEGTQRQFRKAKINPCSLTRLLITHWHGDHILGVPGLLQTLALNGYNRKLEIYGPKGTKFYMDKIMSMFVFEGKINYEIHEVLSGKIFENKDFYIETLPMSHSTFCQAYSFVEKEKIRINKQKLKKLKLKGPIIGELARGKDIIFNGKKIKSKDLTYQEPGKKITFILDTGMNKNTTEIAENSDLLITEATYTKLDKEIAEEYKHLTAHDAADIAKKSKSKKLILTHISQRYDKKEYLILQEAKKIFKNSEIAKDLQAVEV